MAALFLDSKLDEILLFLLIKGNENLSLAYIKAAVKQGFSMIYHKLGVFATGL